MKKENMTKKTATIKSKNTVLASECYIAHSFKDRVLGLMFENGLKMNEGLYLVPCNSIHTFFMKFAIDAVYLDKNGKVMSVQKNIKPWRVAMPVFGAHAVLELNSGAAKELSVGEYICLN